MCLLDAEILAFCVFGVAIFMCININYILMIQFCVMRSPVFKTGVTQITDDTKESLHAVLYNNGASFIQKALIMVF